jgi:hypothetical protein
MIGIDMAYHKVGWLIRQSSNSVIVEGTIGPNNVDLFCEGLKTHSLRCFEMQDLEIDDGVSMAKIISVIRSIKPVRLISAPQMLAHGLYKIGALRDGQIVLENPRFDEGWGA